MIRIASKSTNLKYEMLTGLMYSTFKGSYEGDSRKIEGVPADELYPFLQPHFMHVTREIGKPITKEAYDRYLVNLWNGDRKLLKSIRSLTNESVVLDSKYNEMQRYGLVRILLNKFVEGIHQGHRLVDSFDFGITDWTLPKSVELEAKDPLMTLLSHPKGPRSLYRCAGVRDDRVWNGIANSQAVEKIYYTTFQSTKSTNALATLLENPNSTLQELHGCTFAPTRIRGKVLEDEQLYEAAVARLNSAFANTKAPLRVLNTDIGNAADGILKLLERSDTPIRHLSLDSSISHATVNSFIDTLERCNPPVEILNLGRWLNDYIGDTVSSSTEAVAKLAKYLAESTTLKKLTMYHVNKTILQAIVSNLSITDLAMEINSDLESDPSLEEQISSVFSRAQVGSVSLSRNTDLLKATVTQNSAGKRMSVDIHNIGTNEELRNKFLEELKENCLEDLKVYQNVYLEYSFAPAVADVLTSSSFLKSIDIHCPDTDIRALLPLLVSHPTLEQVRLYGGSFTASDSDAAVISQILSNNKIKSLSLGGESNIITEAGWNQILNALEANHIVTYFRLCDEPEAVEDKIYQITARNSNEQERDSISLVCNPS